MQNSDIIWQIKPHFFDGISLEEKFSKGKTIKISPAREILEFECNGEWYILKIFHAPLLADRIRIWLNPRPWREWKNLQALHSLKMPVPEPVALGKKGKDGYLITKKIPETRSLRDICREYLDLAERRDIATKLAQLTASLHNQGWIHHDFHSGNILLDQKGMLYLVDLYGISHYSSLSQKKAIQNLAMLGVSFALCASYTDFFVFFKEYFYHSRLFQKQSFSDTFKLTNQCFMDWFSSFSAKRAMRCIKSNKYFQKISNEMGTGFIHRQNSIETLPTSIPKGTVWKDSRSTLVQKTSFGVWKQYRRKKIQNLLLDCFRPSRAKKAWIAGYNCFLRGIPTAKPLFFQEKRNFLFLENCYIVTQEIENACILPKYLLGTEDQQRKENLLKQLGKMIHTMHDRGLTHRDLKGNNLLVDQNERIYLIDLDGLSMRKKISQSRRLKDVKRLIKGLKLVKNIEKKDIEIFLDSYLPFARDEEKKRWLKNI